MPRATTAVPSTATKPAGSWPPDSPPDLSCQGEDSILGRGTRRRSAEGSKGGVPQGQKVDGIRVRPTVLTVWCPLELKCFAEAACKRRFLSPAVCDVSQHPYGDHGVKALLGVTASGRAKERKRGSGTEHVEEASSSPMNDTDTRASSQARGTGEAVRGPLTAVRDLVVPRLPSMTNQLDTRGAGYPRGRRSP
jgi:hypothetical protein